MRNNKGFTLMELLVAVFIASMVTVALVTIWKAASIQTSQGQRQTMVRNNLSILLRALHRDITESDLVLAPYQGSSGECNGQEGSLVVMARNAHLESVGVTKIVSKPNVGLSESAKLESDPTVIAYCLNNNAVRRIEIALPEDTADRLAETLVCSLSSACNSGKIYMDYTSVFNVSTNDNINYNINIVVHKDFDNSQTPPINIEVNRTFTKAGGK